MPANIPPSSCTFWETVVGCSWLVRCDYLYRSSGCRTDAEARWPRQCAAIRSCLARLAEYEAAGSEDLGPLPAASKALLITLGGAWVLIAAYAGAQLMKKRKTH